MPIINEFLKYLKDFKIKDGSVSIRCNDTNELLIYIKTNDNIVIPEIPLNVVGIVLNDKVLLMDTNIMLVIILSFKLILGFVQRCLIC